jgi:hypothetical protein
LKTATATVAVVAAAFLAACGGGAAGDRAARHEPTQSSTGTVLAQAKAGSTSRPSARVTHHRPATVRRTPGHPTNAKVAKGSTRRPVRTILHALTAKPHTRPRPAAKGQSLLARVLKQHRGGTPKPVAPSKTAPKKDLLSSITNGLQKPK